MPEAVSSSKKKQVMPASTATQVIAELLLGFALNTSHMMRMAKTGSVNCKTMAFAAVVSLLANTKVCDITKLNPAPRRTALFTVSRLPCQRMKA